MMELFLILTVALDRGIYTYSNRTEHTNSNTQAQTHVQLVSSKVGGLYQCQFPGCDIVYYNYASGYH